MASGNRSDRKRTPSIYPYPTLPSMSSLVLSSDEENYKDETSHFSPRKRTGDVKREDFASRTQSRNDSQTRPQQKQYHNTYISAHMICRRLLNILLKWRAVFIGLFLAFLIILSMDEGSSKDVYHTCYSKEMTIVTDKESNGLELDIVNVAHRLRNFIHIRAGRHDCGYITTSREIGLSTINKDLNINMSSTEFQTVLCLFVHNKHWGIRVYSTDESLITIDNEDDLDSTCTAESTKPNKSFLCLLRELLYQGWKKIKSILIVMVVCLGVVMFLKYYIQRKKTEEAAVFLMVERINKLLLHHYQKSQSNKDIVPYLAIIHVRDALILPSERHRKQVIWDRAVKFVSTKESRVRLETRRVSGEDMAVWRWISPEPPQTEEPDSMWPGKALEDYPPGLESKMAPPVGNPSVCIRVKNMFEPIGRMDPTEIKEIRNAVVKKCLTYGNVVHVYVDKRSTYGCVYFKMDNLANAVRAYKEFHGSWFRSRLVTAKFIQEEKYYKWFPRSLSCQLPLQIDS